MNNKCRILEFYSIKWEYDKSSIDETFFNKLDDTIIEENDQNYQKQFKGRVTATGTNIKATSGGPSGSEDNNSGGSVKPKTKMCTIF